MSVDRDKKIPCPSCGGGLRLKPGVETSTASAAYFVEHDAPPCHTFNDAEVLLNADPLDQPTVRRAVSYVRAIERAAHQEKDHVVSKLNAALGMNEKDDEEYGK